MATVLIVSAEATALVEAVVEVAAAEAEAAELLLGKIICHMFRLYERNMGVLTVHTIIEMFWIKGIFL